MRIAKFIAGAGICSRREAEKMIGQGRVMVDGKIIASPALNVDESNSVAVNGKIIEPASAPRLWVYYKPVGLVVSHKDPQNRPTIFDSLKKKLPRVISVGRLDLNSEGLLLLTNNGDLSRYLESPKNNIDRIYRVRVFGSGREVKIQDKKITIDGVTYRPKSIKMTKQGKSNSWYEVILTEGKNREIRKIFEYFDFEVNRLIRTNFGPYSLENMQPGEFREVSIDENYRW